MSRRDRRGRGLRGDLIPVSVPAYRTRAEQFDDLVVATVAQIERRWEKQLHGAEFAVEEVPASDPAPWEARGVPLARLFPEQAGHPARIVLYRRPIEMRAPGRNDLDRVVHAIVVEQVAQLLGESPSDIDPDYDERSGG
ncbi:metallopeptidase family protein [Rarobacter faecitabidus]|uniref:Zinicin-like metallopeptidase n=2 Tax=Rarobacter faecitabidus TaxID=13243 RepID=A0A542ZUE3_RARFA|nr:zinicin-like metallopeptidase [Rarobacter faecitabidus]